MNTRQVWTLYRKEWLGVMRDRKTMITLILTSLVLYPVLFGVIGLISKSEADKQEATVSRVVFAEQAGERSRAFEEFVAASGQVEVVRGGDPSAALADQKLEAIVRLEETAGGQLQVNVEYDERYGASRTAMTRLQMLSEQYKGQEIAERLQELGVTTAVLEPVALTETNVAPTDKDASMFTSFLPYVLAIGLIAGSMNLGVEITAGEKERGTITTLLVSQLSRTEIALGKLLTTVTMAIISVILNLISLLLGMYLMSKTAGEDLPEGMFSALNASSMLELLLVLLPFGCMVSAGIILLGTYARNAKEGNVYVLPLFFLVMAFGMASGGMDASVDLWMYAVPFMGPLLSIKQVMLNTGNVAGLVVTVATSLVYTALLIWPAVKLYQREEVMFRM